MGFKSNNIYTCSVQSVKAPNRRASLVLHMRFPVPAGRSETEAPMTDKWV